MHVRKYTVGGTATRLTALQTRPGFHKFFRCQDSYIRNESSNMLPCPQQFLQIVEHTRDAARGGQSRGILYWYQLTRNFPAGADTSRLNDRVTTGTSATNCLGQSVLKCFRTFLTRPATPVSRVEKYTYHCPDQTGEALVLQQFLNQVLLHCVRIKAFILIDFFIFKIVY